ncbi:MAG TPA: hypothetical protein VHH88_02895, partial [Verrucomicrobiae bacterium]|nr:hypothetical protein [Verrucomicrobiae bacterium]
EINLESVKQHVLAQLPAWQVPRDWWLVESLQPSQRGKLSRSDWRKRYLARNGKTNEANSKDGNIRAARA